VVNDNKIDFKDFAVFAAQWGPFPSNQESHFYYLTDALGSVRGLIGGKYNREEDREFYNYDVYGAPSESSMPSVAGNPFMFAGYRYDSESGLYFLINRTYDPLTGRFLQNDPIEDTVNLFEYALSNPTNFTDPWRLYGDKWYEKVWETSKQYGMYIGIGIWELPGAYVDTGMSGEQISAWCGCMDTMTDTLNPLGEGTQMGPQYGQGQAYNQGQQVGYVGGLPEGWDAIKDCFSDDWPSFLACLKVESVK
jgi:RHS repeat-associated protein